MNIGSLFFAILGLIFITLKLTHFIDWSWWWVLAPIWAPILFLFICAVIKEIE